MGFTWGLGVRSLEDTKWPSAIGNIRNDHLEERSLNLHKNPAKRTLIDPFEEPLKGPKMDPTLENYPQTLNPIDPWLQATKIQVPHLEPVSFQLGQKSRRKGLHTPKTQSCSFLFHVKQHFE